MKLHTTLISGGLVTAVMADQTTTTRLRRLKADSKASKRSSSSKAAKSSKSSYSYSSSMSYGPPPTPPSPVPPTPLPTPPPTGTPRPTPVPTMAPTGCCDSAAIRQNILDTVYPDGDASIFENSPQKEAIEWLEHDACECGIFCENVDRLVQRYILAVLYYSTQGDSWNACSAPADMQDTEVCINYFYEGYKWLTCSAECSIYNDDDIIQLGWAGTECNSNNELIGIEIPANNLGGQLPAELVSLPKLRLLALDQNYIGGNIPSSFGGLVELERLLLARNFLSGPLFDVSGMTNLQHLDLNGNSLEGSIEGLGWENTNLHFLDLSKNAFTGPIAPEIGSIPTLGIVAMHCNQFDIEPAVNWANCPAVIFQADDDICDSANCPCSLRFACN